MGDIVRDGKFRAIKYWQEYHIPADRNYNLLNNLLADKEGHLSCVAVAERERERERGREGERESEQQQRR